MCEAALKGKRLPFVETCRLRVWRGRAAGVAPSEIIGPEDLCGDADEEAGKLKLTFL